MTLEAVAAMTSEAIAEASAEVTVEVTVEPAAILSTPCQGVPAVTMPAVATAEVRVRAVARARAMDRAVAAVVDTATMDLPFKVVTGDSMT